MIFQFQAEHSRNTLKNPTHHLRRRENLPWRLLVVPSEGVRGVRQGGLVRAGRGVAPAFPLGGLGECPLCHDEA